MCKVDGAALLWRKSGARAAASNIREAFSPIMMVGALVLPELWVGIMEASATRSASTP